MSASSSPKPPPDLERRLRARLEAAPATSAPRPRWSASVVTLVLVALVVAGDLLAHARSDLKVLPRLPLLATSAALGLAAIVFGWASTRRGRFGLGPSMASATTIAICATPLYLLLVVMRPLVTPGIGDVALEPDAFAWAAATCGFASIAIGGCFLAATTLLLRKTSPVVAQLQGAAIGVSCGLVGAWVLQLHCPVGDRAHLAFGHALPIALLGWIGASLSSRALDV
jgi:hypothetical protein